MKRLVVLLVLAALPATAVAASATAAQPTVKVAFSTKLKRQILVGGTGRTLYMFVSDAADTPTCVGNTPFSGCGRVWPPLLTTGSARAGKGAAASLLGTATRSDGRVQVTYNHHPLYYFKGYYPSPPDKQAGDAHGQDFAPDWTALTPKGQPLVKP